MTEHLARVASRGWSAGMATAIVLVVLAKLAPWWVGIPLAIAAGWAVDSVADRHARWYAARHHLPEQEEAKPQWTP